MTQTGHTERTRLTAMEHRRQRAAVSITARMTQAYDSYRWLPLPAKTQTAAWARLLDYAGHLLGASAEPMPQAATTLTLDRWLQRLGRSTDDAIATLLEPKTEPDALFRMLMYTAIEEAIARFDASMMQQAYQLLPATERLEQVRRLREAFPVINKHLRGLPSWAFIDELPTLHGMCVVELSQTDVQHDTDEARYDIGGQSPPESV